MADRMQLTAFRDRTRPTALAALTTLAAAMAQLGCGESPPSHVGADAGVDADVDAGPPEGCVDIIVDATALDDPSRWYRDPREMPRHPFWVDERGVHVAWLASIDDGPVIDGPYFLVVSSFDRATGETVKSRVYDVYPADLPWAGIWDAAGSPDGSFAVVIGHADDSVVDGYVQLVVLGDLDHDEPRAVPLSPWNILDAEIFHVGFDGEAFAVHAVRGSSVWLVRLGADGTEVTPPTEVGSIASIWEDSAAFHTDAETGRTWMATGLSGGLWLSGHERDGTLLEGTEANGGVLITAQGQPPTGEAGGVPGLATKGTEAVLAWQSFFNPGGDTRVQRAHGSTPIGDALLMVDPPTATDKVMTWWQDAWWMGTLRPSTGIDQYRIDTASDGTLTSFARSPLVTFSECSPTCTGTQHDLLFVSTFAAVRFEDELWFGFRDSTAAFTRDEHPVSRDPYRIVRVADRCTYHTMHELDEPR